MNSTTNGKKRPARTRPQCDHGQRRNMVIASLLGDIFQGRLGAGEHLVIHALAKRYQVSPTPIREALVALEANGILDLVPNCGAIVRKVTAADVREICQVRRALECEAIREACGRIELAKLQELAETFRELQAARRPTQRFLARARQADSQLHDLVADASGNRFLAKQIGRLKLLFRAFRDVAWEYEKDHLRIVSEAGEHLAIIEALLAGDAKAASRPMAQHIRSGSKYWSRLFSAS